MKKLWIIPALLLALTACNFAGDDDYENMSRDMCDCFASVESELSDGMKQAIIDADGDQEAFQGKMMEIMQSNPEAGMKDAQVMQKLGSSETPECINSLETKYDDVYSNESETEIQERLIKTLESMDGCELTAAIAKLGIGG